MTRFLGIPYAASPTGPLRFRPPEPPTPWDGVRACTEFGPTPPKPDYVAPFDTLLPEPNIPGDDWLTLNVWTPDPGGAAPVMVWIHGGAFSNGNSAVRIYDGHAFARDGVVLVSINYRLGIDGFALLPDAPPNRGLLDQVAALEWVRDNIAAFGGDPANVTIFGESAGAMSVSTLLGMPRARGPVRQGDRAERSSAGRRGLRRCSAGHRRAQRGTRLRGHPPPPSPTWIWTSSSPRRRPSATPWRPRRTPARWGASIVATSMAFIPVIDGDVLPVHPLAAIAAGQGSDVTLLAGTNTEEFRLFFVPNGLAAMVTSETLPAFLGALGISQQTAAIYQANRPGASAGDVLCALVTDRFFRNPTFAAAQARLAAHGPAPTYLYEFAWPSPVQGVGAAHAMEIPFVFDTIDRPMPSSRSGPSRPPTSLRRCTPPGSGSRRPAIRAGSRSTRATR